MWKKYAFYEKNSSTLTSFYLNLIDFDSIFKAHLKAGLVARLYTLAA